MHQNMWLNMAELKILISAYACGPNWGSEIGMGWNWVINLSNYCQLTIITEKGFQKDIEKTLLLTNVKFKPEFYFIDIGNKGRKLFWKQGSFLFYFYYKIWQKKAFRLSLNLIKTKKFNLIHQLNMIGFREPGYLWKINSLPFIWGPVGGYNQIPWEFLKHFSFRNRIFFSIKNILNLLQIFLLTRPKNAAKRADMIFAATIESKTNLEKHSNKVPIILNETGTQIDKDFKVPGKGLLIPRILWVGKIQGTKALPIALHTLALVKSKFKFEFIIIGDGQDEKDCRELTDKLNITKNCIWKGRLPNEEVISIMRESSFLFFTSLKEGTPHVVTESLQNGLPVLCHDACGHGTIINDSCGIKIPMINFDKSIQLFAEAIIKIISDPNLLNKLSNGALERAKEISWDLKAQTMYKHYKKIINYEKFI